MGCKSSKPKAQNGHKNGTPTDKKKATSPKPESAKASPAANQSPKASSSPAPTPTPAPAKAAPAPVKEEAPAPVQTPAPAPIEVPPAKEEEEVAAASAPAPEEHAAKEEYTHPVVEETVPCEVNAEAAEEKVQERAISPVFDEYVRPLTPVQEKTGPITAAEVQYTQPIVEPQPTTEAQPTSETPRIMKSRPKPRESVKAEEAPAPVAATARPHARAAAGHKEPATTTTTPKQVLPTRKQAAPKAAATPAPKQEQPPQHTGTSYNIIGDGSGASPANGDTLSENGQASLEMVQSAVQEAIDSVQSTIADKPRAEANDVPKQTEEATKVVGNDGAIIDPTSIDIEVPQWQVTRPPPETGGWALLRQIRFVIQMRNITAV